MEDEIDQIDHKIYQAGLKLGKAPTGVDRLGLKHGKIDDSAPGTEVVDEELISQLRSLVKQYGTSSLNESYVWAEDV